MLLHAGRRVSRPRSRGRHPASAAVWGIPGRRAPPGTLSYNSRRARSLAAPPAKVAELVDALDLGSSG